MSCKNILFVVPIKQQFRTVAVFILSFQALFKENIEGTAVLWKTKEVSMDCRVVERVRDDPKIQRLYFSYKGKTGKVAKTYEVPKDIFLDSMVRRNTGTGEGDQYYFPIQGLTKVAPLRRPWVSDYGHKEYLWQAEKPEPLEEQLVLL